MSNRNDDYQKRIKWFHEARFGMFIHWGLYSQIAQFGAWELYNMRIPRAEYEKLADTFRGENFDAEYIVNLAKEAGMRYAVFTSCHHEHFCLFDSSADDFNSVKRAAKRDFVAEFVNACRKVGLKIGLYYSPGDWREPGFWEPEKYPESAGLMRERAKAQIRELMTNYGKIDLLWYDGSLLAQDVNRRSQIASFWGSEEINAEVRNLQPGILINNRFGTAEDIDTPEQHIKEAERGRAWEVCMTMGEPLAWGYVKNNFIKPTRELLKDLVRISAGEGNYLLNIGPKPDGSVREEEVNALREIGQWMKIHSESIYDSKRCVFQDKQIISSWWGIWTRKGSIAYLHCIPWPGEKIRLPRVGTKVISAELMGWDGHPRVNQLSNGILEITGLPEIPPTQPIQVIKIEFEDIPQLYEEIDKSAWLKIDKI